MEEIKNELKDEQLKNDIKKIKKMPKGYKIALIILSIIAIIIGFFLFLPNKETKKDYGRVRDGFVTVGEKSTELIPDLFYTDENGKHFINLINFDGYMNVDVIRNENVYRVITAKNQITITDGSSDYSVNAIEFKDDEKYSAPINVNGYVYADLDKIMETLGYDNISQENFDETIVEIIIKPNENFDEENHTELMPNLIPQFKEEIETSAPQIEDQLKTPIEENRNVEGEEVLPIIPEPTAPAKNDDVIMIDPEILESLANEEKDTEHLVSKQEKKEEKWEYVKEELTETFKESTPQFRQEAYKEISEDVFCFNAASLGTYGNTITVFHDRADGNFMVVQISADWSDQAMNVVTPESKAYYAGLEELYKKTIVDVLGENEGTLFFNYLKAHADKTMTGGYISGRDERGAIISQWTDGPVGDGLQASSLELSQWCGRKTDDGFEYNIVRNGDGIEIYVF